MGGFVLGVLVTLGVMGWISTYGAGLLSIFSLIGITIYLSGVACFFFVYWEDDHGLLMALFAGIFWPLEAIRVMIAES